ncbi:MAG TPA: type II secretion system F family protein [Pirellulales bacterium]|nr:type II secretion system F family protein [Pirellulales bacterium]
MQNSSGNDARNLSGAITSLVASGLPIEQGLRAAASELPRGRTAKALLSIAVKLERGEKLQTVLAAEDRSLPEHLRALVVSGLRSASLGRVLEEFVSAERHAVDVYRKIMLAVSYPALLLLLISSVFVLFCFGVLPGLLEVLDDFDLDLPMQTLALTRLADSGSWMLVGNVLLLAAAWAFLWFAIRIYELRTMLVAVPVLGPVIRWAGLARFSRLLALMVDCELPLAESLELAGRGCQDASLEYAARKAAADMRKGSTLGDALLARRQFPQSLGPMVRWAEQTAQSQPNRTGTNPFGPSTAPAGALADALRIAAEMFESRLEIQLALLRAVAPPLSFLFVVWGVSFLVAAISLPMVNLLDRLT